MYLMSKSRIFLIHDLFSTFSLGNFLEMKMLIKLHSHGQICLREYLFAYMQIYPRVQICSCEWIY